MYVWVRVSVLKNLYRTIRKGKENEARLLRIIERLRDQVHEEDTPIFGSPLGDLFGGIL